MRAVLCGISALLAAAALGAVPIPSSPRPLAGQAKESVPLAEAHAYARTVKMAIDKIALEYVRPIPEQRLAAAAMTALAEAVGAPLPAYLLPDPEKALRARDIDNELVRVRQHLGSTPATRGDEAIRISIQGMMKLLDPPFSAYLTAEELARDGFLTGESVGVGLSFEEKAGPGPLIVSNVVLGSPAQRAGLLPDDRVVEIDGQPAENLLTAEAGRRLGKPEGSRVTLTYHRPGAAQSKTVDMVVTRVRTPILAGSRRLNDSTWDFLWDRANRIGYIRLGPLTSRQFVGSDEPPDTREELTKALKQLQEDGVRGIVLDLRECPGGSLLGAVHAASLFVGQGLIATVEYRDPNKSRPYSGTGEAICPDTPLAVLIGPQTSGGGELIAAALQDARRARLAGQRTRGKASVQNQPENLGGPHYLRLSSGFFLRPSGRNLHRFADSKPQDDWGVLPDPDLEIRLSPALRRQIRAWRLLQDLRPPEARHVLPLDDPEKDPVLFAAWQDLLRRLK
jgi:carboxyl-terminal processing protease